MSVYVKINGWSGSNQEDAAMRLARIFRLSQGEASSAMAQISQGLPWQFEKTITDAQSGKAKAFLTKTGFAVELLPASEMQFSGASTTDDDLYASEENDGSPYSSQPKPKLKPKSSKTGLVVLLLLILAAVGLSQTQVGNDLIVKLVAQPKELIKSSGNESDVKEKPAPAASDKSDAGDSGNKKIKPAGNQSKTEDAILLSIKGDNKGAEKIFTEIIRANPEDPQSYYNRGEVRILLGKTEEAARDYNTSLKLANAAIAKTPDNCKLHKTKGTALAKLKKYDEAIKSMNKAIQMCPKKILYPALLKTIKYKKQENTQ